LSRRTKIVFFLIGVAVIAIILRNNQPAIKSAKVTPPIQLKPLPAEQPTVAVVAPTTSTHTSVHTVVKGSKPKEKSSPATTAKSHEPNEANSNITPELQSKLKKVVALYASWPGAVPMQTLLTELRHEQPFITNGALTKISTEWNSTPRTTFRLQVKGIVMVSRLIAAPRNPNNGLVTVFVSLERHFKPVSARPYSQIAVQPYTVNMQIINREWHVTMIAPQSAGSSANTAT
jgi:hypothetical protein